MKRVFTVVKGHVKGWFRSRSTIFWTIAFPVLMILLFGSIFGGGTSKFDLYVQNRDLLSAEPTNLSVQYVGVLNQTEAFNLITVPAELPSAEALAFVRDDARVHNRGERLLIVPVGFQEQLLNNGNASVQLFMDESQTASASIIGVIQAVTSSFVSQIPPSTSRSILVETESLVARSVRYIDFFIPGVIGMTLLTTGVFGALETNGRYRELRIIKKLATTPLTKLEWILGMVGYQMFLAFISIAIIIGVGRVLFNVNAIVDLYGVLAAVSGAVLFPGIGMLIANFVKDADAANAAGNAITFPMMFLAGTFWPREILPELLRNVSGYLPLSFVNDGLRDAMIYADTSSALTNGVTSLALALAFIIAGTLLTNWREE